MHRILLLTLLSCITVFSFAQSVSETIEPAMKSGNSKALSQKFAQQLDLSLPGHDNTVQKAQAEKLLKNFFQKHPPTSYQTMHQGESKSGLTYMIGALKTSKGDFRVSIYLRGEVIEQLRIQSE